MRLGIRAAAASLAATAFVQQAPAGEAVVPFNLAAAVVTGTGTASPGLHAVPTKQSYAFTSLNVALVGTIRKVTEVGLNTSACAGRATSGIYTPDKTKTPVNFGDSTWFGNGLGTWSCAAGPLAGKSGLLHYTRVGTVQTMLLTEHQGVVVKETPIAVLTCLFVPNALPPALVTSYNLACTGTVADVL